MCSSDLTRAMFGGNTGVEIFASGARYNDTANLQRLGGYTTFGVFHERPLGRGWTGFARLIRSQVLSIRERDFITAAQSMGASSSRIIFKEIMPNLWAPVIVVVSLSLPGYIGAEADYSFLGLGIQPPATTWGLLLAASQRFAMAYPQFFLITAGSLVVVVLATRGRRLRGRD